ncbi:MAG: hypothetical protein H6Q90_5184 [Deltaproteobacteria bacterium]|nr:hypothetical protein [Deltaproteobacteria bacterium]
MRLLILGIAAVLACSGSPRATAPQAPPVARDYPATRWIPAKPTYALSARSVRDAQRAMLDVIDSFGMFGDVDAGQVSGALGQLLGVDALSAPALTAIGVDLAGGVAVFSQAVNPTFVIHLADPAQMQAFFEQLRQRGMSTQSVVVGGAEVFTARIDRSLSVSWVVVDDWMWVHFTLPIGPDEGTAWFTASRQPGAPTWTADWKYASQLPAEQATVIGFLDLRAVMTTISARIPNALACAKLLEPVGRVAFAIEGDGHHAGGRISLDLGGAAGGITRAMMPPPEGWDAVATHAPLAVQWNLDLAAVRGWLAPCGETIDLDLAGLDSFGVRTARVVLQSLDPDAKSGTGVISLDLTSKRYFAGLLDEIPLRSRFESSRTYGPHAGRSLSIPFGPTLDYVLTDSLALAGMGEGLLARAVGKGSGVAGAPARSTVMALDLMPPGLSRDAWVFLLRAARIPGSDKLADRLLRWRDGHLVLTVEGTHLVFQASGNHR